MLPLPNNTSESNRPVRQKNTDKKRSSCAKEQRPIMAQRARTTIDRPSVHERTEKKPPLVQLGRRLVTGIFGAWYGLSMPSARKAGWKPRVEPYVGYGTTKFSRIICRTVYGSTARTFRRRLGRGIRNIFLVPAPRVPVRVSIDGIPVLAGHVGDLSTFESVHDIKQSPASAIRSDEHGYLDLLHAR